MWFPCGGSSTGLVGRNQLWHGCTNRPLTGQINQAAPGLVHCPESTVRRESHLTPVHWLKGASIITVQHSPCHLLSLLLCLLPILFLPPLWFLFSPPSPALLLLSCSATPLQTQQIGIRRLWSEEKCHIVSHHWLCSAQISCDSFLLHCLPDRRRR